MLGEEFRAKEIIDQKVVVCAFVCVARQMFGELKGEKKEFYPRKPSASLE